MFRELVDAYKAELENLYLPATIDNSLIKLFIEELEANIRVFKADIEALQESLQNLSIEICQEMTDQGLPRRTLLIELKKALAINQEYNHPFFTKGLFAACRTPGSITLLTRNDALIVEINLNKTAGSIEDWKNAVESVRRSMQGEKVPLFGNVPVTSSEIALHFWAEKFYAPARLGTKVARRKYNRKTKEYFEKDVTKSQIKKYWNTMKRRLEVAGKLAPYWQIIDDGSAAYGEGQGFPMNSPTRFTEKTRIALEKIFRSRMKQKRGIINKSILEIKAKISASVQMIRDLKALLKRQGPARNQKVQEAFLNKIKGRMNDVDPKKLNKTLMALGLGDISNLSIDTEGRIDLTKSGRRRYRPVITTIADEYGVNY